MLDVDDQSRGGILDFDYAIRLLGLETDDEGEVGLEITADRKVFEIGTTIGGVARQGGLVVPMSLRRTHSDREEGITRDVMSIA